MDRSNNREQPAIKLDRANAVKIFVNLILRYAYDGSIRDIEKLLEKGPPGQAPAEDKLLLHQWFQKLDAQGQKNVKSIIVEAVDAAVFAALVVLDGDSGGYPIPGQLSDFALYLQTYDDDEAEEQDMPDVRIKLNSWNTIEDLHVVFRWLLTEE